MDENDRSAAVQAQYESYPPIRRAIRLTRQSVWLPVRRAICWRSRIISTPDICPGEPFRVLVAGCGTGDAMTMLAQQLVDAGVAAGTVTCLDMSTAS
jgi:ubiquinone/menaquinone biosynthesis C-methylase UbiE